MKDYENTISEWKNLFQELEDKGHGNETVACAIWFKETVENFIKGSGYRAEMSEDEWKHYAKKTEESWSEFNEEDLDYAVDTLNLAHEGEG